MSLSFEEIESVYYKSLWMAASEYDHYSFTDYKKLLKQRLNFIRKSTPALTWRAIAEKISIQATYLSKALNDGVTHLSDDHLFGICQILEFKPDETDFVLLLRALNTTQDRNREEYLTKKIQDLKKKRIISADFVDTQGSDLSHQMNYLLDPTTVLVHCALFIPKYKKDPLQLCSQLGIGQKRLRKSLEILHSCKYVVMGANPFEVIEVNSVSPHFSREHPLTRTHQTALKASLMSRLTQTAESAKESFIVIFTMDEQGFHRSKEAFAEFIKKVQSIAQSSRHDKLYQLNFDLLEWF